MDGGGPGSKTRIVKLGTDDSSVEIASKTSLTLAAGEGVRVETLGGGGFGPPSERENELIRNDILDGKTTRGAAEEVYGRERVKQAMSDNSSD